MQVPVSTPRKVARTVCKTVVDITTIEDCQVDIRLDIYISKYLDIQYLHTQETVTTECTQTSTKVAHSSAVVGHDTKVS